jgi:1-phosphofructokinase
LIVTVTPNPSLDRTLYIDRLDRGTFIRAAHSTTEAGGKGINVARALTTHEIPAVAVVPASAASAAVLRQLLGDAATLDTVEVDGEIRTNISIVEPDGTTTKINEPGPPLAPGEETALADAVLGLAATSQWVCGCGSIPPGMTTDFYAQLAAAAPSGVRVAVDADGEPLLASIAARVALIKPNREELERVVGRSLPTLGDVVDSAAALVDDGPNQILVSLGADGAVLVTPRSATHGEASGAPVVNTVGAGDALLAGFLACGADVAALPEAIAWSVAACASAGTRMRRTTAADRALVAVHPTIDRSRRLAG